MLDTKPPTPDAKNSAALTEKELTLLSGKIDDQEQQIIDSPSGPSGFHPIGPISPSIIAYAVFKDQILMPLIQGFLWTEISISIRPFFGNNCAAGSEMWVMALEYFGVK